MHEFEYHFGNISTKLILMPKTKSTDHPPTCSTNIADRKFSLTAYHHECTGAKCKITSQKWEGGYDGQSIPKLVKHLCKLVRHWCKLLEPRRCH